MSRHHNFFYKKCSSLKKAAPAWDASMGPYHVEGSQSYSCSPDLSPPLAEVMQVPTGTDTSNLLCQQCTPHLSFKPTLHSSPLVLTVLIIHSPACLGQKTWESILNSSPLLCKPLANPICSIYKICPECSHFPPVPFNHGAGS